ncbi:uncharacterized protein LOC115219506 [Argonauta hians]
MAHTQNPGNANKVQRCYKNLVNDLDDVALDAILDEFLSKFYISQEEYNIIRAERYIEAKNRCFLNILLEKIKREDKLNTTRLYDGFIASLRENDLPPIISYITEADSSSIVDPILQSILKNTGDIELSEKLLGRIINCVGSGWEAVATELGVDRDKIFISKDQNLYTRKFTAFNAWRKKEGFRPDGLKKLLETFNELSDKCEVKWIGIQKCIENYKSS